MQYLLNKPHTTPSNAKHSKTLALELYDKCEGAAKLPFDNLSATRDLVLPGKGIEILRLLANKFGFISQGVTTNWKCKQWC